MKKLVSIILAIVLVLSLGITAFAAEGKGSITITNATVGQTYAVYKLFDATYTEADGTKAVSYTVQKDTLAYKAVTSEDGQKYFAYSAETGIVSKKEGVNDSELIAYLTGVVTAEDSGFTPVTSVKAEDDTVLFSNLDYGYYLITSDLGAAVTITSNTPDVQVIDKNQKPGAGFDKVILVDGVADADDKDSAAVGDRVTYQISLTATNYDGDKHIQYYQILDTLGSAFSPEVSSFQLKVGDKTLPNGWLLNNTNESAGAAEGPLSTWDDTVAAREVENAQWYLVYLGGNKFRVTIPWQSNHAISGNTGSYKIEFPAETEHASIYDSPSDIVLTYSVFVKYDAIIGGGSHDAMINTANASWTSANETGTTATASVLTEVFGLGLLKDDGTTGRNLPGAKFSVWADKDCTEPVYIIPTDIEGVYILDSKNSDAEKANASTEILSRNKYATGLTAYLGEKEQENYAVTPVNGKIVILGLDAGTYYLREDQAPDGYNALTAPVEIKVGEGQTPFYVFANAEGKVADLRDPNGDYARNTYDVTHSTVHNSKGVELPSTGGEGTMLLVTLGTVMAIAFAVFLITHKKMSVYAD